MMEIQIIPKSSIPVLVKFPDGRESVIKFKGNSKVKFVLEIIRSSCLLLGGRLEQDDVVYDGETLENDENSRFYFIGGVLSVALPPIEYDSTSELSLESVKLSSKLSDIDFEMILKDQILSRDENLCVFCSSADSLVAAHIFNVKDSSDYAMMREFHLHTLYDIGNGITLCEDCHKLFDFDLCSVHVENNDNSNVFIVVAENVLQSSDEKVRLKWNYLNGKPVRIPNDPVELLRTWPLTSLFQYRESEFLLINSQRRKKDIAKKSLN